MTAPENVSDNLYTVLAKEAERRQLQADVDAFLARGGRVEQIEPGLHEGTRPAHPVMRGSEARFRGKAGATERQKDITANDKRVAQKRRRKETAHA